MKPLPFILLALAFLYSCHMSGTSTTALTEDNMYFLDTVRLAAAGGNEGEARKILQDGIDAYKKKGADTAKTIALFKHSIFTQPTPKAYYELSGALLATKQYAEALKALAIAEKLGYTPLANVMFRYAYAYEHLEDSTNEPDNGKTNVLHYMELAIQMGYAHPRQFVQKNLFPHLTGTPLFDATYTNVLGGGAEVNPERSLWDAYEHQFPEVQLPLVIDRKWADTHPPTDYISMQYEKFIPEMRNAKFSREGGNSYYYAALLHKDASFVAVIYCVRDETEDGYGTPAYVLETYNPQGAIIDGLAIAGQRDATEGFANFRIAASLAFQVQPFKNIYKEDPVKAGYDSTNILRQDAQAPTEYHITAAGKIEPAGSPIAMR